MLADLISGDSFIGIHVGQKVANRTPYICRVYCMSIVCE